MIAAGVSMQVAILNDCVSVMWLVASKPLYLQRCAALSSRVVIQSSVTDSKVSPRP
jgi:hypothetical protein